MNELTSWSPLNIDKKSVFYTCMNKIMQLEDNFVPGNWVEWKNYSNQVVIGTDKYYYKIYVQDHEAGTFFAQIAEELGRIYRELGIEWNVTIVEDKGVIHILEQREKLKVILPGIISFEDLLLNYGITLRKLEERLGLNELVAQIMDKIPEVKYVKLIRDCANKYIDYASKNGAIVLLDDADWFLMLLDKDYNQIAPTYTSMLVSLPIGEYLFAPQNYRESNKLAAVNKKVDKWWLFNPIVGKDKANIDFRSKRDKMISSNAKLLTTMKALPVEEKENIIPYSTKENIEWINNKMEKIGYEG